MEEYGSFVTFPAHFHPGTTEPGSAAPITLRPGEEVVADFVLTPVPAVTLTLRSPSGPVRLRLGSEGIQGTPILQGGSDAESAHHIFRLVPGRYTAWFGSSTDEQALTQTIDVPAHGAVVELIPDHYAKIEAKVEIQGIAPAARAGLGLVLLSDDFSRRVPRVIPSDGSLKYPRMHPGRYRLVLIGPTAREAYIDRVSAEGARYTEGILGVSAGAAVMLRVGISGYGGRVEGKVYRADRPFPGALVVLAPRTDTGDLTDYHGFVSDNDGSFEYRSIKPGEYVIFVIADGSQFEYANPAAVAPYLDSGRPVRVEPGGTVNLRLELPPR
jgi:hypothetical protein